MVEVEAGSQRAADTPKKATTPPLGGGDVDFVHAAVYGACAAAAAAAGGAAAGGGGGGARGKAAGAAVRGGGVAVRGGCVAVVGKDGEGGGGDVVQLPQRLLLLRQTGGDSSPVRADVRNACALHHQGTWEAKTYSPYAREMAIMRWRSCAAVCAITVAERRRTGPTCPPFWAVDLRRVRQSRRCLREEVSLTANRAVAARPLRTTGRAP